MRKLFKSNRSQAGFTLLETLIAMAIMTGGIIILANSWSGNVMRIQNSRVNNMTASLLERKMTEIEIQYKDKPPAEIPEEDSGDFGPAFPGYRWEMAAKPFEMPDISAMLAQKEGGMNETTMLILKTVNDYIKETVKEVAVSIYYKSRRGRETKNTIVSYLVDYSKEIPMPGGMNTGSGAAGGAGATGTGSAGTGATGRTK
jgi:general secretion pathway protein I